MGNSNFRNLLFSHKALVQKSEMKNLNLGEWSKEKWVLTNADEATVILYTTKKNIFKWLNFEYAVKGINL